MASPSGDLTALIMAAGRGTRMNSSLPKVLHPICGRPMVEWVAEAARAAGAGRVVCVVRPGDGVADALPPGLEAVEQREGEGTGAAINAARDAIAPDATLLVLSGDHPLVSAGELAALAALHAREGFAATMLSSTELDPTGYGRVVRGVDGEVERVVETKDPTAVTAVELAIREVNLGAYAFAAGPLFRALAAVAETAGERYLPGVLPLLREAGHRVGALATGHRATAMGVNSRVDLMVATEEAQGEIRRRHALAGVTFLAPQTVLVDVGVEIGRDAVIGPGVTLRGRTRIGEGATVGPHSTLIDAEVGDGASVVHAYLVECTVGAGATVGPFAYLRPGARLDERAKAGTFVEVKNSTIGRGAKVPHLSYIGDADVGEGANIGAGNITANYDGRRKHRTEIGAGARTGVHSSYVAPVRVGEGAYTGAGSVITKDVPPGALGIARSRQRNLEGYAEKREEAADEQR